MMIIKDCDKCGKDYMYDAHMQPQYENQCQYCVDLICKYCDRELPNKDYCTKEGCRWCNDGGKYDIKKINKMNYKKRKIITREIKI